jgi:hypothetical protein
MSKQIQAYFQTEDQAEGAKTTLIGYKTEHLEVSKLENSIGRKTNPLVPLVAMNPSGNMGTAGAIGITGAGGIAGNSIVPVVLGNDIESDVPKGSNTNEKGDLTNAADINSDNYEALNYVLSAKVEDEHYDEIVQKLRQVNAHIEALSKM